ncbi:sulfurtransferase TusA family protein [Pseudoduganella rivuli]|nr:sulfurtransferase TusA family protein [Pseudoduganella rivuli]
MQAAISPNTTVVDVTGLPAPEPLLSILEALELMPDGGVIQVRMDEDLPPLARILQEFDYRRDGGWQPDGSYGLRIWRG